MPVLYEGLRVISFLLLVLVGIHAARRNPSKEQFCMILVVIGICVYGIGFQEQMTATTEEGALLGFKLGYVGKCYVDWLLFVLVISYCGIKRQYGLQLALFLIHSVELLFALDIWHQNLYYRAVQIVPDSAGQRLAFVPGPMFYVDMALVVFYGIAMPFLCFRHYYRNRKHEKNRMLLLFGVLGILPLLGWPMALLHLGTTNEIVCWSQFITSVLFWLVVYHYHIFDTLQIAKETVIDSLADALVVLDYDFRVLYCNDAALNMLPGIEEANSEEWKLVKSFCQAVRDVWENEGKYYEVVVKTIQNGQQLRGYIVSLSDITDHIHYTENLESMVEAKTEKLESIQQQVIISFANMIEMRDDVTGDHVKRTSEYVRILAEGAARAGVYADVLTPEYIQVLCKAAPLHDVGKIVVSDTVLCKPGRLTTEEFDKIKQHSSMGGQIIGEVLNEVGNDSYLETAKDMASYHHERWDGTGYPSRLCGEQIPLCARIMAVADVFDALVSKRSYKEAFTYDQAFDIIASSSGSHFDPRLVDVFLSLREEIEKVARH